MAVVRAGFRTGWWRTASILVAAVIAVLAITALLEPATGPWYQYTVGRLVLIGAPVAIVTGLLIRTRHRWQGSALVALGLLPGADAIVLFWYPPSLMFGFFSIAVMAGASIDADNARRTAFTAPRSRSAVLSATDWSTPSPHRRDRARRRGGRVSIAARVHQEIVAPDRAGADTAPRQRHTTDRRRWSAAGAGDGDGDDVGGVSVE